MYYLGVTLLLLPHPTWQLNLETCNQRLGLENGKINDSSLTASSSYDPTNVGPANARLNGEKHGGAWCPKDPISPEKDDEYFQIDLVDTHVITEVLTQGRFANGQGQEYARAYRLHYWRKGMDGFKEYHDSLGRTILPGNKNTYTVANNSLNPPILASKLRILPHSNHSRTVCLRVGLRGCHFTEGVESYSIVQGHVRGGMELMDITYDGQEDHVNANLRGGLGQLVDGKYGPTDFKATGNNGIVKGYEWIGWKNRSMGPLQLDFTFDKVRMFHRMDIHINNHYTRDIQIFSRAKIYFSNEEGKFGDDRAVDFHYVPDKMIEDARNVSINLRGEHGKYVMIHLYFAAKWILISEVTFMSETYEEKPFTVAPVEGKVEEDKGKIVLPPVVEDREPPSIIVSVPRQDEDSSSKSILHQTDEESPQPKYVGLIIGILLTLISFLLVGILFVIYRGRQGKETPTHSLIANKLHDKLTASIDFKDMSGSYTPYKAKMRVYGHVPATEQDHGTYKDTSNQKIYTAGYPSLNKKFNSDPILSEDCTDDYAEPQLNMDRNNMNSFSCADNIYAQALPTQNHYPSNPINHYTKPLSPITPLSQVFSSPDSQPFLQYSTQPAFSQPQRFSPPKTLNLSSIYGTTRLDPPESQLQRLDQTQSLLHSNIHRTHRRSRSQSEEVKDFHPPDVSPSQSSLSSVDRFYQTKSSKPESIHKLPVYSKVKKLSAGQKLSGRKSDSDFSRGSSGAGIPQLRELSDVGITQLRELSGTGIPQLRELSGAGIPQLHELSSVGVPQLRESSGSGIPHYDIKVIARSELKILEKIGRGQFGEVHSCHFVDSSNNDSSVVAVKSMDSTASAVMRSDFETEARVLFSTSDINLARVLGVNTEEDPWLMVTEFSDHGDLNQFLQDHVAETTLSKSPGVSTLSFGSLIYMATQIASGMKHLESIKFVHRDLATRNCLVYPKYGIKISDCGLAKPCYSPDYYTTGEGSLLPIRWMAWESLLLGKQTSKSDVWSFGVTLWEILTFAREQPYEDLSDEKVIDNVSNLYQNGRLLVKLPQPYNCPREIFDLIVECWHKNEAQRPNFREIHLFLQRKNLAFCLEDEVKKE